MNLPFRKLEDWVVEATRFLLVVVSALLLLSLTCAGAIEMLWRVFGPLLIEAWSVVAYLFG